MRVMTSFRHSVRGLASGGRPAYLTSAAWEYWSSSAIGGGGTS